MSHTDLEHSIQDVRNAVLLESIFPHRVRKYILSILLLLFATLMLFSSGILGTVNTYVSGLTLIVLGVIALLFMYEAYYYAHINTARYGGLEAYVLAELVHRIKNGDVLSGVQKTHFGQEVLVRCGIDEDSQELFLKERTFPVEFSSLSFEKSENPLLSFFEELYEKDHEFERLLRTHSIKKEMFIDAVSWVVALQKKRAEKGRWWSQESLQFVRPIGEDWAYGRAYALMKYAHPLRVSISPTSRFRLKESRELETTLSRSTGANALIVGGEGSGKLEVIEQVLLRIRSNKVQKALQRKKIMVFDVHAFTAVTKSEKDIFERELILLCNQVVEAGNLILVFPDLPAFIGAGEGVGSDVIDILKPYLVSGRVQIVGVSPTETFHSDIESHQEITTHFEVLKLEESTADEILQTIQADVIRLEEREGVIFSYPAIHTAVTAAGRYFVSNPLLDTSFDLLLEGATHARSQGAGLVTEVHILSLVEEKTGTPTGEIKEEEKDTLVHLKEHLKERIVGQDAALEVITQALLRARAGVNNPNRPIGSFLFAGPTGVGKTETTKALAEIYFGHDASVLRLDMSEFNGEDGMERLIGSPRSNEVGILVKKLKENPYGVLLLDEFEKTHPNVLDLFLQVLDEGMFSDARGMRVSARNVIIIATTNAGSDLIFKKVRAGAMRESFKQEFIEAIIEKGIFKPELVNRFDAVVLFHPLTQDGLAQIARQAVKKLEWRLKEKGIVLEVNDELISFLVSKGSDPLFGARALNRAVQDTLETVVANKIVSGELQPGGTYRFSLSDIRSE